MEGVNMIKVDRVSKKYDNDFVLNNLSFNIKDNCIYGLVGANGAGKSTLLRIIMGIFDANMGSVTIDGEEVSHNVKLKQKMVFIPDDLFFYPGYTLIDMAKYYQSMYDEFDMDYLRELAKLLKLKENVKISNFSKGMKRQCALICAIATNADYMFFDETFDGLDPVIRNVMKKIIVKQMNKKKTTIVMTSHNLRELEDICDNLGLLYQGGILFESEIDTIKTNMYKVQISLKGDFDKDDFSDIDLLSYKKNGSVATLIIKDVDNTSKKKLAKKNPIILDYLNLTLEEIFIYEMEAMGYEFNKLV
jgi:ABC-2 type transport system ATP-binding protein